ncbi:transcription antitermination factor NusB [Naumannella halotolerans]|uniref:Transcription antitermination protein NusB n=1 Tax=Naumannella halotolerans TaxID=993414 RepID=A0A4R7J7P4_9ACTN|nr:transcription antitermination factor NusB [Naumannella halotolerans]TDT33471.1 N utilization substance protein B [Naumannella halotolerans]
MAAQNETPVEVQPVKGHAPRTKLSTRSKARKAALDILFAAELRGTDAKQLLNAQIAAGDPPVREFTRELVRGVADHAEAIDDRLRAAINPGWTLERMPRVDRIAARLGVYELDWTEVAPDVAIAEAVALAGDLSTDESPAFLSGLLGRVAED